ncbi:hypothetical protein NL676_028111 [Syzygium grande]|nr:hypothetical protein NL676_028111 [Syzygium grande]
MADVAAPPPPPRATEELPPPEPPLAEPPREHAPAEQGELPPAEPAPPAAAAAAVATTTAVESELLEKAPPAHEEVVVSVDATKKPEPQAEPRKVTQPFASFKEESNKVADLSDPERNALEELKQLCQEALNSNTFFSKQAPEQEPETGDASVSAGEASIWGIPLLKDERTDVVLLKFLRARDFKVKDAFVMLRSTVRWRKDFSIDAFVDEDLGDDLEKVVFMHGHDREGHPVCYNVYGEFQNKELYQKTFADEEKRAKFLRWRVQFLERSIRKLDFNPGGTCTIFQVSDLKNSPGPGKRELRIATKQALQMLQDNYPEFVAKQVFINVPWWTKSKFVFASPSRTTETLFKYISPEQVPVQYGGLSVDYCDCDPEFTVSDPATEMTVKPGTKQIVEIIIYEKCVITWELRVVGWEVSYGAEFVPNTGGYSINIQKPKKMSPADEPVAHGTFKVSELGKVLLTVDNPTSKKKKLLYRFKIELLGD